MARSKVAALFTRPHSVIKDIGLLMDLAGFESCLQKNRPTILKTNISWHLFFPGANTTPWQLNGVIEKCLESGITNLFIVENNSVVTDPEKGEKPNRYTSLFERYRIPVKYNFKKEDMRWIVYEPKGEMLILNKIYPEGIKIPDFFIDKNIIHLPTIKTHIYSTITCSMKNAFGGLLSTKRHYTYSYIHETLVDLLTIQKEIHPGIFAVADGTTCGSGPGPRTMIPHIKNILLASSDCVAIDSVAAKLMGFDPMSIPFIRLAHERGLGTGSPREIDVVGDDISNLNFRFNVGDNLASRVGDALWFGPLRFAQKLAFRTPLVYTFIFGSYIYHDYIWYPMKGARVVREYMKTAWGRLFETY